MKTNLLKLLILLFSTAAFSQVGHIMQGVGAVNMSMGGAATGQPLDISGAMQWNPASLSAFNGKILKFDIGAFSGSPKLYSTYGPLSGSTEDDKGLSPMPAAGFVWSKEGSKSTFGISVFGVSGFGVDFQEDQNYPQDRFGNPNPDYNPNEPSNPINFPQIAGGFGNLASDYMLLQVGFTWAYAVSETFSIGVQPILNYGALEIGPNPLASPNQSGYPNSDRAGSIGFGGQIGLFYDTQTGFKIGASYKTQQYLAEMEFDSKYLDGTKTSDTKFTMNYPAVYSLGIGYSKGDVDLAVDYRYVDYENTEGFEAIGWTIAESGPMTGFPTGSVSGFGWESINVISAGLQYKGIEKFPLRVGYTYSSNPINDRLAFFSTPATAIIKNAFQFGFSYQPNDNFSLDVVYHHGDSGGTTSGKMMNPTPAMDFNQDGYPDGPWHATQNPLGEIPDSEVSYDMTTDLIMVGFSYTFKKKEKQTN
jgi:long-chain fatty acid transport protein